jgi:hypothetical protein
MWFLNDILVFCKSYEEAREDIENSGRIGACNSKNIPVKNRATAPRKKPKNREKGKVVRAND